jgi:hypothetical protein
MKEAQSSSETSLLTRATRRNIPEDAILPSCYARKSSVNFKLQRRIRIRNSVNLSTVLTEWCFSDPQGKLKDSPELGYDRVISCPLSFIIHCYAVT